MIGNLLRTLLGALFGNVGGAASGVSRVVEWGAVLAAVAPLVMWFRDGGKDEVLLTLHLTYGEAAFIAAVAWWVLRVSHRAPAPAPWFQQRPPAP